MWSTKAINVAGFLAVCGFFPLLQHSSKHKCLYFWLWYWYRCLVSPRCHWVPWIPNRVQCQQMQMNRGWKQSNKVWVMRKQRGNVNGLALWLKKGRRVQDAPRRRSSRHPLCSPLSAPSCWCQPSGNQHHICHCHPCQLPAAIPSSCPPLCHRSSVDLLRFCYFLHL